MNDLHTLDTLDRLGPAPTSLSEATLAAARSRLEAAVRQESTVVELAPRRRLPLLAAAAAVAIGLAVVPALVGGDDSVALAGTEPLTFPWTPRAVPAGLGEPVFDQDSGSLGARYGAQLDGLTVRTHADADQWDVPPSAVGTEVDGEPASVYDRTVHDGGSGSATAVTVVWEDDSQGWTAVTGSGSFADRGQVMAFAEALQEQPQRVDLSLSVAPRGWSVAAYKEDRVLVLSASGTPGPDDLTVVRLDRMSADLSAYGARDEAVVSVQGGTGRVGRAPEGGWVLEGRTSTGQPFSLQAPAALTRGQVVEIADGVGYRP